MGLLAKHIRRALAMARELGIQLPSTSVADDMLSEAIELGYERRDIAALFEVLSRTNDAASHGR